MPASLSQLSDRLLQGILSCFFLSGAAGLIYQVVWIRLLGLVFGHTVHAVTTVLVAFMAGLALGSYLCARVADRIRDRLRFYGVLEIGIGLYCLATPWLIEIIKALYVHVAKSVALSFEILTLVQFVLASLVLLIPTTLMGATLPLLSRSIAKDLDSTGRRVGLLYAVNTFGAVLGTYLVGFELLPLIGIRSTLLVAAAINIGVGLLALMIARRAQGRLWPGLRDVQDAPGAAGSVAHSPPPGWGLPEWAVVIGFALSGASAMVYEVTWTRALALIIGSSTYAFSAMLLSFLIGIALGSAGFARFARPGIRSPSWFAGLQLAIALSAASVFYALDRLPGVFLALFPLAQSLGSYTVVLFLQVLISVAAMLVPTVLLGMTFPCAIQILSRNVASIGYEVGRVYAFNTAGAIVGAFAAGFLLVPSIGVQASIKVAVVVNLLVGAVLLLVLSRRGVARVAVGVGTLSGVIGVILLPAWDQRVMSSGVAVYAPLYVDNPKGIAFSDRLRKDVLLYYRDGISSTVTVHREGNVRFLRVNGKTDASSGGDMHTQLMSGHLPALFHPAPQKALVIGLASGVTVGALTQHDLERIDVVEIEPAMIEASAYFSQENRNALADPRVRVIIADGRNFLETTAERYDLIISEPSNPWIGGIAALFTVEFFDLVRRHLTPNGIMVQWFYGYNSTLHDIKMVAASFQSVFPHATLWETIPSDYLFIGGRDPLVVDLDRIRSVYQGSAGLRDDFMRINANVPEALLADFFLDGEDLRRLTTGAELNTDDGLPLEFSAPRSLYLDTAKKNYVTLRKFRRSSLPPLYSSRPLDINSPEVHYQLGLTLMAKGRTKESIEHLEAALDRNPRYLPALLARGRFYTLANRVAEAVEDFQAVLDVDPSSAEAHNKLGTLYLHLQKADEAVAYFRRAVALDPANEDYRIDLAASLGGNRN